MNLKDITDLPENVIDDFYINIGKQVKLFRTNKGYTQLQLSQALGHKSVGLVSQAEIYLNKQHFNIEHLYKIAYVLDIDISEFFKDIKTKKD